MKGRRKAFCGSLIAVSYRNGRALWKGCGGSAFEPLNGMVKS